VRASERERERERERGREREQQQAGRMGGVKEAMDVRGVMFDPGRRCGGM
jgi:hypothetical protein